MLQGTPGLNGTDGDPGEPGSMGRPGKQVKNIKRTSVSWVMGMGAGSRIRIGMGTVVAV